MRRRGSLEILRVALVLGACLLARPAPAQNAAAADALFDKGMERLKANDYEAACPLFEESRRLDPKPGVLFTLAACESKRGRIATALTLYEDYLEIVSALPPAQRSHQQARERVARKEKESLKSSVPMLTVVMPESAPSKLVVKRDGEAMGKPSLGVALPVDPGEHVVTVHGDGDKTLLTEKVTLSPKEQRTIQLPATYAAANEHPTDGAPAPTPPPADSGVPIALPIAALAVGGLGLGIGAVFGALAMERKSVVNAECQGTVCRTEEGRSAGETGHTFATISTVSFIVGGVAAAAGITLLIVGNGTSKPAAGAAPVSVQAGAMIGAGTAGALLSGRF